MFSKSFRAFTVCNTNAFGRPRAAAAVATALAFASGSAQAQSASSTLSSYRSGYGGAGLSGLSAPVSPSLISTASQYTISDGVNQAGSVGSVLVIQTTTTPSSSGVEQVAAANTRTPVAIADGEAANATPAHAVTPSAPPGELVLNGKINLDGGQ